MSKDLFFEQRQAELSEFVENVENGDINPLTAYAEIKQFKEMFTSVEKQIEPLAFNEAETYPEKSFEAFGYGFEKRNGGVSYNYKNISEWQEKYNALKEVEERSKQAFISRQKGLLIASEDGEEIELPTITHRKNSLVVKKSTLSTH